MRSLEESEMIAHMQSLLWSSNDVDLVPRLCSSNVPYSVPGGSPFCINDNDNVNVPSWLFFNVYMLWKTFPWRTLGLTWLEHTNFCKVASSDRLGILVLLVNSIYREMTNKGLSILLLYRRSRQGDVHRGNRHWCRIDDLLATASAVRQFHMILLIESSDIMSTSSSWVDARYGWFMCAAAVAFRCCSCL